MKDNKDTNELTNSFKRGKNKIQSPLKLIDAHKYFIKDLDVNSKYNISWELYKLIIAEFNKRIMEAIIVDGLFFKMPYRLGTIRLRKRKTNLEKLKPNYKVYNQSNREIKSSHLNEHTDGYYVRFYWNKADGVIVKNKTLYSFIPTRDNSRNLASLLKKDSNQINKYFE